VWEGNDIGSWIGVGIAVTSVGVGVGVVVVVLVLVGIGIGRGIGAAIAGYVLINVGRHDGTIVLRGGELRL
jgi:hypothetical protein